MEPLPQRPPPPPPPTLPSVLAHLRSLLSVASSALSSLPSPPLPHSNTATTTTSSSTAPSPLPTTTALPPLSSSPTSAIPLPVPLSAAPALYSDCPAVVRIITTTATPPPASSSLPAFLAAECADFFSSTAVPTISSPPRILPSEFCLLRREVDSWGSHHLPGAYSYAAARVAAALRSGVPQWESELRRWVLTSSSRYGVMIDAVTRDHVFVLVRLCLKVVAAEAGCSLGRAWNGEGGGSCFDLSAMRFECPRLVGGVSWLGVQLEILYGEGNGRFFAVAAVKEAMLWMGSWLAVGVGDGVGGGRGGEAGASGGAGETGSDLGDVGAGSVFVSQVAAAIVALHERFSLEEKIRALQVPRSSKYQLLLEYSQALEQGHEERSKRPNYRAVLEYDGILSRRVESQESGRAKTREELLAEERDYKRRRMSYRGKKVKRNPTEILRDIIDEHMEEIKQAGGVGCLVEAPGGIAQNMVKSNSHGGTYQGSYYPKSSSYDKAVLGSRSPSCENSPRADYFARVSSRSLDTRDSYRNLRYETCGHHYQNVSEHENRGIKESESPVDRRYSDQYENNRHKRNSNDQWKKFGYKYKKDVSEYHSESSDCTTWSTRTRKSLETEYDLMLGDRSNARSRASQNRHRSVSNQDQFSDRYDPQSRY